MLLKFCLLKDFFVAVALFSSAANSSFVFVNVTLELDCHCSLTRHKWVNKWNRDLL